MHPITSQPLSLLTFDDLLDPDLGSVPPHLGDEGSEEHRGPRCPPLLGPRPRGGAGAGALQGQEQEQEHEVVPGVAAGSHWLQVARHGLRGSQAATADMVGEMLLASNRESTVYYFLFRYIPYICLLLNKLGYIC